MLYCSKIIIILSLKLQLLLLLSSQIVNLLSMYGHTLYSKSVDQPGKVANPARDQLNREN